MMYAECLILIGASSSSACSSWISLTAADADRGCADAVTADVDATAVAAAAPLLLLLLHAAPLLQTLVESLLRHQSYILAPSVDRVRWMSLDITASVGTASN